MYKQKEKNGDQKIENIKTNMKKDILKINERQTLVTE